MAEPQSLEVARENLLYIRKTLEAAGQLTAVSGKSLVLAGIFSFAGVAANAWITGAPWSNGSYPRLAFAVWGIVLILSLATVLAGMYYKSRQMSTPIQIPLVRKLLWSLCPALFLGALLTGLAVSWGHSEWLPVVWLGCYGVAITNGGQVSIVPIRSMGLCFLLAATGAAFSPKEAGLAWLALGFSWLHIAYGVYIARRHHG
jgi:hypothetical protein